MLLPISSSGQVLEQALFHLNFALVYGTAQRPSPRVTVTNGNAHILGQASFAKAMAAIKNDNATERLAGSIGRPHSPPALGLLGQRFQTNGARLFVKVGNVGLSSSSTTGLAHSRHDGSLASALLFVVEEWNVNVREGGCAERVHVHTVKKRRPNTKA